MNALVVGWFSFRHSDFTAGDLLASDVVCDWLRTIGYRCDVATVPPLPASVDLDRVNPDDYDVAVFVCGPFMQNALEARFLGRFAECFVVGVNLTLPVPLHTWCPFDFLLERDSSDRARPDLTFASPTRLVPIVGVCLVEPYDGAMVDVANEAIRRLLTSREMAVVPIDTRLDANAAGLRTPAEIESLLARMDAVVTTRLHGTVLALKHGVPVLAIDPEPNGAKIKRQADAIGWPIVSTVDALDEEALRRALDECLSPSARAAARACAARTIPAIERMRSEFMVAAREFRRPGPKRHERSAFGGRTRAEEKMPDEGPTTESS